MSIVFAILLFSILIFVHELGHFMAAKASNVRVNEFAMFMGPAIFKKRVGETLYSIRCIPIGGFCAMEGEDADTDDPRSFQKAAWWKRLIILVAGAAMNFLIGILIMVIVYMPSKQFLVPVIDYAEPGCTVVSEEGLHLGDRILEVDGEKVYLQSDFSMILALNPGDVHDLVVERDGNQVVLDDLVMEKHEFIETDGSTSVRYGFSFAVEDATLGSKLATAWRSCLNTVRTVRLSLQMLVSGQAGLKDMSGPVGIVQIMSDTAQNSPTIMDAIFNMLYFGGFIAINLAVMNLLPIPALDGGRVVGLLLTTGIQAVIGRKINPKIEGYIHGVGMVLLLALMGLIMFKDIFVIVKG
ncbi:MAG: site-2 protease family protein [Oscillospiraceae bacterium]|nr:site-2 protease family protein [Oscillospiraceae bacterium]